MGCGVDIAQGKAFFTKNGVYLGIAFDNVDTSRDLFPCFGLNTEGERINVNFGQVPFVFDIENHVQVSPIRWVKENGRRWLLMTHYVYRNKEQIPYDAYGSNVKIAIFTSDHLPSPPMYIPTM